jgi:hypothetical protein
LPDPAAGAGRSIAILQSSYIPWKGYFDLMNSVDEFVLFDDVQYTKRDWRNRNQIKTPRGTEWLTIPVKVAGSYLQKVRETRVDSDAWPREHWAALTHNYARAPFFGAYRERFEELYLGATSPMLSEVNHHFLTALAGTLGIATRISWSMDYEIVEGRTERLVHICRQAGATEYLSGPSARAYIDPGAFDAAGIALKYADYTGYPEYPQLHGPFEHHVSILDLLFNTGPGATRYMKSFAARPVAR